MKKYILKRFLSFIPVLLGVSILSFLLIAFSGKDPAEAIARRGDINATPELIEQVRVEMGLDGSLPERYVRWIKGFFTGDLGISLTSYQPVSEDLAKYVPITVTLVLLAMIWTAVLAIPLSLLCARFKDSIFDHLTRGVTILGICVPTFWLGFMLMIVFAINLKWFTVVPTGSFRDYILPSFTLAVPVFCGVVRQFRSSLLAELSSDYVRYAKARGLSNTRILLCHVFRNALPPIVTVFCQFLGSLLAGGMIVECVYSMEGLGAYLVRNIVAADSTTTATCVVIVAAVFIVSNLLGDIINRLICPWIVSEKNDQ